MGLPAGGVPVLEKEKKAENRERERYGKFPAQKSIQTGRSRGSAPRPRRVRPTSANSRPAAAGGSRGRGKRWKSGTVSWTGAALHGGDYPRRRPAQEFLQRPDGCR